MKRTISSKPERYFALHLSPGLAEYKSPKGEPFKVLVERDAAVEMDTTFEGCPVYVLHEDDVDVENLKMEEVDGLVAKSFYNKWDGNHWAEFIAITDQAKSAINVNHWKVSNCSITDEAGPGGKWQGSEYRHSIKKGHYEHLAIVPNPRYTQSIVLTPDEFREYNASLEEKLTRLNNSVEDDLNDDKSETEEDSMKWNFFRVKNEKIENGDELATMSVTLPKSKKVIQIDRLLNEADESEVLRLENADKPKYANDDDKVKLENGEEMSVKDCKKAMNAMKKKNEDAEKEVEDDLENADDEEKDKDKDKDKNKNKNADDDITDEKLLNSEDDSLTPVQMKRKIGLLSKQLQDGNFERLKNASQSKSSGQSAQPRIMTSLEAVQSGAKKYGSAK